MDAPVETYEPRYLAGIVLFNRHDFFEAHEVWESLWQDCCGPERRFYQGLIQAAVGLLHFGNGNLRGALKLYRSSRDYMERYGSPFLGLDRKAFWQQMERCFAGALAEGPESHIDLDPGLIPEITLDPAPTRWPDPADYEEDNESSHE
jgi:predicted metal-dependent hydrolase